MRVSLSPHRSNSTSLDQGKAPPLLDPGGASSILGSCSAEGALAEPIRPAADTLFGPRGAVLVTPSGPLVVCDTGHHRLLLWHETPRHDGAPADLVIGQPGFDREGRNAKAAIGANTLNVPTGIACDGRVLAVADAWNHRVLLWLGLPTRSNQPADVVLGQSDFTQGLANRGEPAPTAATLNWCYGVALDRGALWVADTGNRRVLKWHDIPRSNGTPADLVLGQTAFTTRDENGGRSPDACGMRWPHGMAIVQERLFVADAGNNRVMCWEAPHQDGEPCDLVLGQADFGGVDHNQAAYFPTSRALNMPYGATVLAGSLVIADTANSRLLGFDLDRIEMNAPASRLAAQPGFGDKGDNRWGVPRRDSLCWPYSVSSCGNTLVIADSGNNRVMLWEAAA